MRTTLSINDALLTEVRRRANKAGRPFRAVLEEMISLGLASAKRSPSKARVRISARRLGLKPAYHNISLNQLFDQLEAEQTIAKIRGQR